VPARSLRELERLLSGSQVAGAGDLYATGARWLFLWADQVLTAAAFDGTLPKLRPADPHQLQPQAWKWIVAVSSPPMEAGGPCSPINTTTWLKISSDRAAGPPADQRRCPGRGFGREELAPWLSGEAIASPFNVRLRVEGLRRWPTENGWELAAAIAPPHTSRSPCRWRIPGLQPYLVMPVQIRS